VPSTSSDIVAPITAFGKAPVAAIRISGPNSIDIASKVFPSLTQASKPKMAIYGKFAHGDDGYVIPFESAASFTGEACVEMFVHGSRLSVDRLISLCLKAGAILAEPGEFTLRAFLNGRIDLAQAEAVADVIEAKSEKMLRASVNQSQGSLARQLIPLGESLNDILISLNAWVDFSEEIGELDVRQMKATLRSVHNELSRCCKVAVASMIQRKGFRIVIAGAPNSGKSTLFNRLLGTERAIVTAIPGTTRDYLQESFFISGTEIDLIDTAGIRDSQDEIEMLGIERSHRAIASADLLLYVIDSQLPSPDLSFVQDLNRQGNPPFLTVWNKIDLNPDLEAQDHERDCYISSVTGKGIEQLLFKIQSKLDSDFEELPYFPNSRQKEILAYARESVGVALESLNSATHIDLISSVIQDAIKDLGLISGTEANAEIIHEIFSKFCIGK